jgi:hypothetical protein
MHGKLGQIWHNSRINSFRQKKSSVKKPRKDGINGKRNLATTYYQLEMILQAMMLQLYTQISRRYVTPVASCLELWIQGTVS